MLRFDNSRTHAILPIMRRVLTWVSLLVALLILLSASADTEVYITRSGKSYHRAGCGSLSRSCIPISLGNAVAGGYRACKNCDPPLLDNAQKPEPKTKSKPQDVAPIGLVAVELVRVTDGDTIRVILEGKETPVRLIGIDTPEKHNQEEPEPFALEAAAFTEKILKDRDIWLEFDVERFDKYDRVLAHVWAQGSGDRDKLFVNGQIIRAGLAQLLTIPPNVKYVERLKSALAAAKKDKLNLWVDIS